MRIALADYGAGNLRSLCFALERAGGEPYVTVAPDEIIEAPLAVIAGVGHLANAAAGLARTGLDEAIRSRVETGRPVAGICVGLQLFFDESDEGGRGLGLLRGPVTRLDARRVPHMGWNTLAVKGTRPLLQGVEGEDVYFAHSYAVVPTDENAIAATVDHDGDVVAAVATDGLVGLQFHPERSAAAGARVLENLLRWSRSD